MFKYVPTRPNPPGVSTSEMEVLSYLKEKSRNLNSLERNPIMKTLFIKNNTTLPSSAPVERLFSFGGITLSPKRSKFSDQTFEQLVLLSSNKDIMEIIN